MQALLQDPIVWMCLSVLTFGLVLLIFLIGKLKQASGAPAPFAKTQTPGNLFPFAAKEAEPTTPVIDFSHPTPSAAPFQTPTAAVPTDVVTDRLDTMVQRLGEMQNVLLRQANQPPSVGGQGLPPETVDKLLKIIGNVVQQIDVLQKNMGAPATASSVMSATLPPAAAPAATPPAAASPSFSSKIIIEHSQAAKAVPSLPVTPPSATPPAGVKPIPAFAPTQPPATAKPTPLPPTPTKGPSFGPTFGGARPAGSKPPEPGKPA